MLATPAAPAAAVPPPIVSAPPIAGGRPFTVAFDGTVLTGTIAIRAVRDIDRLMKVLQAQKAAFEAMEDDEDPRDQDLVHDTARERALEDQHEADEGKAQREDISEREIRGLRRDY